MRAFIIITLALAVYSCQSPEPNAMKEESPLQTQVKKLEQEAAAKDSAIGTFIRSLNEIEDNLALIREKEGIITLKNMPETEISEDRREMIIDDIKLINSLMEENRNKLSHLQHQLKNSNLKIKELDQIIDRLSKQLLEKDEQIMALKGELEKVNIMLSNLYTAYNERLEEMADQKEALNAAWYAFGSFKELKEQGVLTKEGGFIGIGGRKKLQDQFNRDYFTGIDITETTEIPLFSNKAKIVTHHPSESYRLQEEEAGNNLIIRDPAKFWSVSKYLVVVID